MKIALISQPWARAWPPSDSIAIWNLEVGRRLAAAGHEVAIWGPLLGPSPPGDRASGVAIQLVPMRADWRAQRLLAPVARALPSRRPFFATPVFYGAYAARVVAGLRRFGPDAVHVHNFSQWVPPVRRACPRATVALHMHCDWLSTLHRPTMARRAARADLVLGAAEHITARTRASLPAAAERCHTIPNGVDLDHFAPAAAPRPEGLRLIAIGRLSPEKGVHRLLEAFTHIVAQRPEAHLELVGAEAPVPREMLIGLEDDPVLRALERFPERGYLAQASATLSPAARERVQTDGDVPHADVPARLATADVLVAASLSEAFGMPVIEAMAAGVPVVATAVGGMREIVEDGVNGLLVRRDDPHALAGAVLRLAAEPALRRRLGEAGRLSVAERYSWEVVTERLLSLYEGAPRAGILPQRA